MSFTHDGNKFVDVTNPYPGAGEGYHYLLVPRGNKIPDHDAKTTVVSIPVDRLVCTSTTHIPLLDYLNETDKLVGFPTTDYISSPAMRRRIDQGKVTDLGMDKGMNLERLVTLKPSLVMAYQMNNDLGQLKKIQTLGIPVVVNAEYLEKNPLGRAEWIKFMALFFNKEREADSVFTSIETEYAKTQALVQNTLDKPTVMCGIVYGDTWFLPGGNNYAAKMLADGGYTYFWYDNPAEGFLELNFESCTKKRGTPISGLALDPSKPWRRSALPMSVIQIQSVSKRQRVYLQCPTGAKGGSEFLELGYLRPDIILQDLVKIAHPDQLPDHVLYFYARLK